MKNTFLIIVLLFSLAGSSQSTIDKTMVSGGITRSYKLYIPASYNSSTPVALVLNLHGLGSNSLQQMFYGDFRPIADTANFIIVHPQGTYEPTSFMANYWNAYFGGTVNDINFLSEMIDTISANYSIDANKIHSTGMSNGGYMSLAIALGLNDKIASVASVTGSMTVAFPSTFVSTKPISVLQIHGTADSTVKYDGDINSISIPSVLNYWITNNSTVTTPIIDSIPDIITTDNSTAIRYTYGGGIDNTEVIHYKVVGGEHTWPNSTFVTGITNRDFDASKVIWAFFNKHPRVNTISLRETAEKEFVSVINDLNTGLLKIKNLNPDAILEYVIYDLNGKLISRNQLNSSSDIVVQSYKPGMYVIKISRVNSVDFKSVKFLVR